MVIDVDYVPRHGIQHPSAEINVLDRRLATGEKITYVYQGTTWIHRVAKMIDHTLKPA